MSVYKATKRGTPIKCTTTGEIFPSIEDAAAAKRTTYSSIKKCLDGERDSVRGLSWEIVERPTSGTPWKPEELAVLEAHRGEDVATYMHLIPGRSKKAIRLKVLGNAPRYQRIEQYENRARRPLTEETAYQCRIEYEDKIARGYTPEQAFRWVAEANERDLDIVKDAILNPAHDAQVEECKRKYTDPDVLDDYAEVTEEGVLEALKRLGEAEHGVSVPVVGTNITTGEQIVFRQQQDVAAMGFNPGRVSECITGKRRSHKGYTWERIQKL